MDSYEHSLIQLRQQVQWLRDDINALIKVVNAQREQLADFLAECEEEDAGSENEGSPSGEWDYTTLTQST